MRLAIVFAALIGAAALLFLLPVGLDARYTAGNFTLTARVWPVAVQLLPRSRGREADTGGLVSKRGGLRRVPPPVLAASARRCLGQAGKLCRRVRLKRLRLRFTAGGSDPGRAVMAYARAGVAMEGIDALCAGRVRQLALRAEVDFDGETALDADLSAQTRLGYLLWTGFIFCFAFFREYYRYRKTEG